MNHYVQLIQDIKAAVEEEIREAGEDAGRNIEEKRAQAEADLFLESVVVKEVQAAIIGLRVNGFEADRGAPDDEAFHSCVLRLAKGGIIQFKAGVAAAAPSGTASPQITYRTADGPDQIVEMNQEQLG